MGAILASLATDVAEPLDRLAAVTVSTRAGKAQFDGMSQAAAMAYSGALLSPAAAQSALSTARVPTPLPHSFNLTVSNVPGPTDTRYFRGSELRGMYPASIPFHGALSVTFMGYRDTLDCGFVGDRDAIPHLQRLAVYTGQALAELGAAVDAVDAAEEPAADGSAR